VRVKYADIWKKSGNAFDGKYQKSSQKREEASATSGRYDFKKDNDL
jgi:hypothetical protein